MTIGQGIGRGRWQPVCQPTTPVPQMLFQLQWGRLRLPWLLKGIELQTDLFCLICSSRCAKKRTNKTKKKTIIKLVPPVYTLLCIQLLHCLTGIRDMPYMHLHHGPHTMHLLIKPIESRNLGFEVKPLSVVVQHSKVQDQRMCFKATLCSCVLWDNATQVSRSPRFL